ncbi:MAG: hypothetical protein NTX50_08290 [Candidatus Sumerlaeota bacterium]|nr:hypothetical protein [Candidatus Sumerlaeota bacterium]
MQSESAPAFGVRLLAAAFASMVYKIGVAKAATSNRTPKAGAVRIRMNLLFLRENLR